jgi:hypothetical protein
MLFTIDVGTREQFGVASTAPTGWQFATQVHSMGPEGFIFARPVTASIPLPTGINLGVNDVAMFDYDRAGGQWVNLGGRLSADNKSVEIDAIHLCTNMLLARAWSAQGVGAIRFTTVTGYSFKVCIESYTLANPTYDAGFNPDRVARIDRRDASTTPADGFQYWRLPQGTYSFSVEVYVHNQSQPSQPPSYIGYFQRQITISQPHWNWQSPGTAPDYANAVSFGDMIISPNGLTTGPAPCSQTPTPSVGIGSINVRLEWRADADLDLWVYDPCGNRIYWNRTSALCGTSTGTLDLDNLCGNLVLGRPENIYWGSAPPRGTYVVKVHYYGDCSSAGSVFYTVRWLVSGQAYSKSGTISQYDSVTVTQFTY